MIHTPIARQQWTNPQGRQPMCRTMTAAELESMMMQSPQTSNCDYQNTCNNLVKSIPPKLITGKQISEGMAFISPGKPLVSFKDARFNHKMHKKSQQLSATQTHQNSISNSPSRASKHLVTVQLQDLQRLREQKKIQKQNSRLSYTPTQLPISKFNLEGTMIRLNQERNTSEMTCYRDVEVEEELRILIDDQNQDDYQTQFAKEVSPNAGQRYVVPSGLSMRNSFVNDYTPFNKQPDSKKCKKADLLKSSKYIQNEICNVKIVDIKELDDVIKSSTQIRSRPTQSVIGASSSLLKQNLTSSISSCSNAVKAKQYKVIDLINENYSSADLKVSVTIERPGSRVTTPRTTNEGKPSQYSSLHSNMKDQTEIFSMKSRVKNGENRSKNASSSLSRQKSNSRLDQIIKKYSNKQNLTKKSSSNQVNGALAIETRSGNHTQRPVSFKVNGVKSRNYEETMNPAHKPNSCNILFTQRNRKTQESRLIQDESSQPPTKLTIKLNDIIEEMVQVTQLQTPLTKRSEDSRPSSKMLKQHLSSSYGRVSTSACKQLSGSLNFSTHKRIQNLVGGKLSPRQDQKSRMFPSTQKLQIKGNTTKDSKERLASSDSDRVKIKVIEQQKPKGKGIQDLEKLIKMEYKKLQKYSYQRSVIDKSTLSNSSSQTKIKSSTSVLGNISNIKQQARMLKTSTDTQANIQTSVKASAQNKLLGSPCCQMTTFFLYQNSPLRKRGDAQIKNDENQVRTIVTQDLLSSHKTSHFQTMSNSHKPSNKKQIPTWKNYQAGQGKQRWTQKIADKIKKEVEEKEKKSTKQEINKSSEEIITISAQALKLSLKNTIDLSKIEQEQSSAMIRPSKDVSLIYGNQVEDSDQSRFFYENPEMSEPNLHQQYQLHSSSSLQVFTEGCNDDTQEIYLKENDFTKKKHSKFFLEYPRESAMEIENILFQQRH